MNTFLKALLTELDTTLEIEIEVLFEGELLPINCTLVQAFDDNYVENVLKLTPLSNTKKVNVLSETFRYLENRDAINYITLPLKQREKINMEEITNNYRLLGAAIKSYFNDNSNIIPMEINKAKLQKMFIDRKKVKELQQESKNATK